jgi:hypothetical protein
VETIKEFLGNVFQPAFTHTWACSKNKQGD